MSKDTWNGDLYSVAGAGGLSPLNAADKLCLRELTTLTSWQGYSAAKSKGQLVASKVHAFLCNGGSGCNNLRPETTYYFANAGDSTVGGASFTTDSNGNPLRDVTLYDQNGNPLVPPLQTAQAGYDYLKRFAEHIRAEERSKIEQTQSQENEALRNRTTSPDAPSGPAGGEGYPKDIDELQAARLWRERQLASGQ